MAAVVVLSGPIGVGKTTLGRALATALGGAFLDSDDLRDPARSWVQEVRVILDRLVAEGSVLLRHKPVLVIAKPLRARDWAGLRARFAARGIPAFCVTLTASAEAILDAGRARQFSAAEAARMRVMLAEGYGARAFSDWTLRTDAAPFQETAAALVAGCRLLLARLEQP